MRVLCIATREASSGGSIGLSNTGDGTWVGDNKGIGVDFVGLLKQYPIDFIESSSDPIARNLIICRASL